MRRRSGPPLINSDAPAPKNRLKPAKRMIVPITVPLASHAHIMARTAGGKHRNSAARYFGLSDAESQISRRAAALIAASSVNRASKPSGFSIVKGEISSSQTNARKYKTQKASSAIVAPLQAASDGGNATR